MAKENWIQATVAVAPFLWVCGCCGGVRLCQCEEGTEKAPGPIEGLALPEADAPVPGSKGLEYPEESR